MLKLNSAVVELFKIMMQVPQHTKIFIPTISETGELTRPFTVNSCRVSGLTREDSSFVKYNTTKDFHDVTRMEIGVHPHPGLFKLQEQFHYAFALPYINEDGSPIMVTDKLRQWEISRHNADHKAPLHIILLEQMYNAVLEGGYFGAVLPRRWLGNLMKYMKWWNESIAQVAKVQLPKEAVERWIFNTDDILTDINKYQTLDQEAINNLPEYCRAIKAPNVSTGNWTLCIWQKPVNPETCKRSNKLFFATFRYSTFVGKLKPILKKPDAEGKIDDEGGTKPLGSALDEDATEAVRNSFYKHDWFKYSVRMWLELLKDGRDAKYTPSSYDQPVTIRDPKDTRVLEVSDRNKPSYQVAQSIAAMKLDPLAVHIKVTSPPKVYGYSPQAQGLLHDIRQAAGFSDEEVRRAATSPRKGDKPRDKFVVKLKSGTFSDNREWLLKTLQDHGLHPFLTASDDRKFRKEERWQNINLTPIKRTVKTPSPDNGDEWETLYDDVDVKASYPEIWSMWESRAKRMKLHTKKFAYEFQYEDIVTMACKAGILNSNVMGLGKTREILLLQLLLGIERGLYVVPSRLIGEWQNEIEQTIANYARYARKNWMGKLIHADYKIIQWADDCQEENLRTFNILAYENLAKIPRDAAFYVCPACSFVSCSIKKGFAGKREADHRPGFADQICPKCNYGKKQRAMELNAIKGYRKRKEKVVGPDGREVVREVDDRVSSGNFVMMNRVEEIYVKMKELIIRTKERSTDPKTFGEMIDVMTVKKLERTPHLKWTFTEQLRNRFKFVAIDESNEINNPKSQRSQAIFHLTGSRRVAATGTPVRGYPRSIVNVLNWVLRRSVFSDYRSENKSDRGSKKFERKYGTYVQREGAAPKLIPKINQPELFQQELAPFMIRHLRHEPLVAKDIPPRTPIIQEKIIKMDDQHAAYYQNWLDVFAEWWRLKRLEEDHQENPKVVNDLLIKLGYLINASSIPHFMLDGLESEEGKAWAQLIRRYEGPLTQKFITCKGMIEKYIDAGDKTIVFCWRRANLTLGQAWCKAHKPPIYSVRVDGTVPNKIRTGINRSEKHIRIDKFRYHDVHVLWAGIKTMKEGFNIPEANRGIFMDYTWEPADWQQALARMLRPAQKKTVHGTFLCHEGTVDEYVAALVQLKGRSADEGVDYRAFDDFNAGMIPDFVQYANAIVDGKVKETARRMWLAVDELRKQQEEEGE